RNVRLDVPSWFIELSPFHSSHHTYHCHHRRIPSPIHVDTLADRISIGPVTFGEFLVDDDHIESAAQILLARASAHMFTIILLVEGAALQHWNVQGAKVIDPGSLHVHRRPLMRQ